MTKTTITQAVREIVRIPGSPQKIVIQEPQTQVVAITSPGPIGPQGPKGDTGDSFATVPAQSNTFFAGPISGDPDLPDFRKIAGQDIGGITIDGGNF